MTGPSSPPADVSALALADAPAAAPPAGGLSRPRCGRAVSRPPKPGRVRGAARRGLIGSRRRRTTDWYLRPGVRPARPSRPSQARRGRHHPTPLIPAARRGTVPRTRRIRPRPAQPGPGPASVPVKPLPVKPGASQPEPRRPPRPGPARRGEPPPRPAIPGPPGRSSLPPAAPREPGAPDRTARPGRAPARKRTTVAAGLTLLPPICKTSTSRAPSRAQHRPGPANLLLGPRTLDRENQAAGIQQSDRETGEPVHRSDGTGGDHIGGQLARHILGPSPPHLGICHAQDLRCTPAGR